MCMPRSPPATTMSELTSELTSELGSKHAGPRKLVSMNSSEIWCLQFIHDTDSCGPQSETLFFATSKEAADVGTVIHIFYKYPIRDMCFKRVDIERNISKWLHDPRAVAFLSLPPPK